MFNYMMVDQSEQFSFIRIPKMMLTDDLFSKISLQAKVLYGLLLDRMGKAMENLQPPVNESCGVPQVPASKAVQPDAYGRGD